MVIIFPVWSTWIYIDNLFQVFELASEIWEKTFIMPPIS